MKRPKIQLNKTRLDYALEIIGMVLLSLTIILVAMKYADLPNTIPTHFDSKGNPDGYGAKSTLLFLPIISAFIFIVLYVANKYPHTMNIPGNITEENAEQQYRNATQMIRVISVIIVGVFFYITYVSINVASGQSNGLGTWFTPIFLTTLFAPIIYYIRNSMKMT